MSEPFNVHDYELLARERLDDNAWEYLRGGAGDEATLRDNIAAFGRWKLRPRVLVATDRIDTSTTVLGTPIAAPIVVAPLATQKLFHPDGEAATARAAAAAGTLMVLSSSATMRPAAVADAAPGAPRWFQVYVFRDRGITQALIDEACANDYGALVLTVDTPILGRREGALRVGFHIPAGLEVAADIFEGLDSSIGWRDLEWLAGHGLPVVLKGVITAEDAQRAVEHGAAAVVVSNHGGRQLDGVSAIDRRVASGRRGGRRPGGGAAGQRRPPGSGRPPRARAGSARRARRKRDGLRPRRRRRRGSPRCPRPSP